MLLMSMGLPIFIRCVATLWCCLVAEAIAKTVGGILAYIYLLLLLCIVERKS